MKKVIYNGLFILALLLAIIATSSFIPKSVDTNTEIIDEFVVYPPLPNDLYKSNRYEVNISQNGNTADSYVYMRGNEFPLSSRPFMVPFKHKSGLSL